MREAWGCESQERYTIARGTPYETVTLGCPAKALEGWERLCIDLYFDYRNHGVLPVFGGALDQSEQARTAFRLLDDVFDTLRPKK